jgi:uncharacterized membrane protein
MSKDRLETFTDSVIAILMTILVLDLHAPTLGPGTSLLTYLNILAPLWPHFFSFAMSFFVLSVYWVNHHYFFRYVKSVNTAMLWLNVLLLFALAFIPFSTSLLAAEPANAYAIGTYALNTMLGGFAFFLLRAYVYRNKLFNCDATEALATFSPWKSVPGLLISAAAIVAVFINIPVALALLILYPIFYAAPGNIWHAGFKRFTRRFANA